MDRLSSSDTVHPRHCLLWIFFLFQNQSAKGDSLLSFFKNLTTLRSEDTFRIGDYRPAIVDNSVFSFVREFDGKKG